MKYYSAEADDKAKEVEKYEARAKVSDLYNDLDMAKERAKELRDEADEMVAEAEGRLDEAMKAYCDKYGSIIIGKCKHVTTDKDDVKCTSRDEDYYDRLKAAEREFNEVIGDLLDIFRI